MTPKPTISIPIPTTSITNWCTTRESSIPVPFKPTLTDTQHLPSRHVNIHLHPMTHQWINPSSTKHTIHSVPWRDWFPPYSDDPMELRSRHHAANLSLTCWTLNSSFLCVCVCVLLSKGEKNGTLLTTRVQAHVPAYKTKLIKKMDFSLTNGLLLW